MDRVKRLSALLLLLWLVVAAAAPQNLDSLLEQAKGAIAAGRSQEALSLLARAKGIRPRDARPYFYSGVVLADRNRLVEASAELSQAHRLDPQNGEYALILAEALEESGSDAQALAALSLFDTPGKMDTLTPDQLWLLADLYFRLEKSKRSLKVLEFYARERPREARVELKRGQIFLGEGQLKEAVAAFRSALNLPLKKESVAHFGLGVALYLQSQLEPARHALERAVAEEPHNAEYAYHLARVLDTLGKRKQAIRVLEEVRDGWEGFPRIYDLLGRIHRALGEKKKALAALERFQQLEQKRQRAKTTRVRSDQMLAQGKKALASQQVGRARQLFEKVLKLDPENWTAHSYLAKIYLSSGYEALAGRHLARMQAIDPESFEGNYLLALYRYRQGRARQALEPALKARGLRPGYADLRNLLGNIYLSLGERDKAREEYGWALRLEPGRADFRANYQSLAGGDQKKRPHPEG